MSLRLGKLLRSWSHCICIIFIIVCCSQDGQCALEINMLDVVNLKPSTISLFNDIKLTRGADGKSPAYTLGANAGGLFNTVDYADFKTNFDTSNDTTLVFTFKLEKKSISQKQTAFSLISTNLGRLYLSFVIQVTNSTDVGIEGQGGDKDTLSMSVDINYRVSATDQLSTVKLDNRVNLAEWQTLMIRILNHKELEVYLGCSMIPQKQSLFYKLPALPGRAQIRATQTARRNIFSGQPEIDHRVVGDVQRLEFLFGNAAFDFLNPCIPRENTLRPEGLKSTDAEKKYILRYLELTGQNLPRDCSYNGASYTSGDTWKKGTCETCTCTNGLVDCKADQCPNTGACKDGTIKPEGECCTICQESYCARFGKVYFKCGCTNKCGDAAAPTDCASRCTSGCHCPAGQYEDIDGKCVVQYSCRCLSEDGNTIYKPNEIGSSSQCLFSVCTLGTLRSIRVCYA